MFSDLKSPQYILFPQLIRGKVTHHPISNILGQNSVLVRAGVVYNSVLKDLGGKNSICNRREPEENFDVHNKTLGETFKKYCHLLQGIKQQIQNSQDSSLLVRSLQSDTFVRTYAKLDIHTKRRRKILDVEYFPHEQPGASCERVM